MLRPSSNVQFRFRVQLRPVLLRPSPLRLLQLLILDTLLCLNLEGHCTSHLPATPGYPYFRDQYRRRATALCGQRPRWTHISHSAESESRKAVFHFSRLRLTRCRLHPPLRVRPCIYEPSPRSMGNRRRRRHHLGHSRNQQSTVDPKRLAIRGISAGGFTTLASISNLSDVSFFSAETLSLWGLGPCTS